MKKIIFGVIFIFLYCRTNSYLIPIDSNSEVVKFRKLTPQIYLIEDMNYWKTNSLFYISKNEVYFFSSGWTPKSAEQILWKAKVLTYNPFKGLFLIAPTLDFSGGIVRFREENIPILIEKEGYNYLTQHWYRWQMDMDQKFLSWIQEESLPQFAGFIDNTMELDNKNLILFYPGNILVPGNLLLYINDENILYGGNLIHNPDEYFLYLNPEQKEKFLNLILELKKLPVKTIITGKGSPVYSKKLLDKLYDFYKNYN